MRVLLLVTDDWFFWSHRLHLAREIRDAGGEVHVATSRGAYAARIEAEGFHLHPVRFARTLLGQPRNVLLLRRLADLYRELRPDVVHHVSFLPVFYGSLAARMAGMGAVVNAVTGLGHAFVDGGRAMRRLLERCYAIALAGPRTRAIFQNEEDRELFVARGLVPRGRSVVVAGAGVDTEAFRPSPEPAGRPVVLLIGRMLWSKGVGVLVDASRRVRERGIDHELWLLGEPHPTNPDSIPRAELEAWHERGDARWLGRREDVSEWIPRASVVALPSYYREGVPLALIEAAAAGRPIVTTDTPGCRDIVRHGENGLLVPPRDAGALAGALAGLLADPERRARLGAGGRERALARFSKEIVNARTLEVYGELVPRSRELPSAARGPEPRAALPDVREGPSTGATAAGAAAEERPA